MGWGRANVMKGRAVDLLEFQREVSRWRHLEDLALAAEQELKEAGLLTCSPEAAALVRDAFDKRREADSCLLRLLRNDPAADEDTRQSPMRANQGRG